jgi:uncharacterized membrane protein YphA (DoxX/SURF4 family)
MHQRITSQRLAEAAPAVVRWGLGIVFLIFGIWQWAAPTSWYGYLPSSLPLGIAQGTAIALNGTLDFVIGALILLGLLTRIAAIIGAAHLAIIASTLGWNDVMVRDLGLVIVALGVALRGPDRLCLDQRVRKETAFGRIAHALE